MKQNKQTKNLPIVKLGVVLKPGLRLFDPAGHALDLQKPPFIKQLCYLGHARDSLQDLVVRLAFPLGLML